MSLAFRELAAMSAVNCPRSAFSFSATRKKKSHLRNSGEQHDQALCGHREHDRPTLLSGSQPQRPPASTLPQLARLPLGSLPGPGGFFFILCFGLFDINSRLILMHASAEPGAVQYIIEVVFT